LVLPFSAELGSPRASRLLAAIESTVVVLEHVFATVAVEVALLSEDGRGKNWEGNTMGDEPTLKPGTRPGRTPAEFIMLPAAAIRLG
jgi:hypothetical protein